MLQKPFGPYKILAGDHTEDEHVLSVKVKEVMPGAIIVHDDKNAAGKRLAISRDAYVLVGEEALACYRDNVRTAPADLQPGDAVDLAREVTWRIRWVDGEPAMERRSGHGAWVKAEPFMSGTDLAGRFNQGRGSIKFELATGGQTDVDELLRLRQENEHLKKRAVERASRADAGLDKMSVEQLRQHAEAEEIELPPGNQSKEALLKAIRTSRQAVAV